MFKYLTKKKTDSSKSSSNSNKGLNKKTKKLFLKNFFGNNESINVSKGLDVENRKVFPGLEHYIPSSNKDIVHPKYWELPSRKHFYNWIMDEFNQYEIGNSKKQKVHVPRLKQHFELSNIQRLTRDYLQGESPVRGLLLYLGLGVGKTCTAITISEAILTRKEVIVISKASLEPNWIKEIKQCGADYVRNQNHWVFKTCDSEEMKDLANHLGIPDSIININRGVFLVDYRKKESNLNELSNIEREKLDLQIDAILESRFRFIHYDDTHGLWKKVQPESFDNKIIIIDEVHNIGNTMASKVSKNAEKWYNQFMNAKNPKIIFLSGTPMINRVFEITKIFNILRGYMHVLEIRFKVTFDTGIDYDKIMYTLKQNKYVDQIIKNKAKKVIKVTMNPENFVNSPDNKGIIYRPNEAISKDVFENQIREIIQKMGYKTVIEWRNPPSTVFPEDEEEFEQLFYNRELNKLKRLDLIKRRIAGLTSYYEYQDKTNYPKLLPLNILQIPMSEYQFSKYETYRHQELEKEKLLKRRNKPDEEEPQSSYRLKSRMACSFAFPEETGSPYDSQSNEDNLEIIENLQERISTLGIRASQAEHMKNDELRKRIQEGYLKLLERDKDIYLDVKNGSLAKYSPKYLTMLLNIQKQAPNGKILVYSQFISLIGLNIFSLILQQSGNWAPFRIRKVNKIWEIEERDEDIGKYRYIFYSGSENNEMRDILIKIFNSEWESLPSSCEKLIKQLKKINDNNYYGEIIKMIMTTRTGAEGLDLKEIRYIHVSEPFWQPVLIQQVIGRGVRNKSHLKLIPADRNVEVFIYMSSITPNLVRKISYIDVRNDTYKYPNPALADKVNKVVTSDEYLYLTAERKKYIINEFQKLMKESAFDCLLNYKENKLNPDNKTLVCMDYSNKNRDDYLFTPEISDTVEGIELAQEKVVAIQYGSIEDKKTGKIYYYEMKPNAMGKMYIYGDELKTRVRTPKPIGEVKIINGQRKFIIKAKKK